MTRSGSYDLVPRPDVGSPQEWLSPASCHAATGFASSRTNCRTRITPGPAWVRGRSESRRRSPLFFGQFQLGYSRTCVGTVPHMPRETSTHPASGGCDLVPRDGGLRPALSIGAASPQSACADWDLQLRLSGTEPGIAWTERRSDPRPRSGLLTGPCPKCGKRKIRRVNGVKRCPRCGPLKPPVKLT